MRRTPAVLQSAVVSLCMGLSGAAAQQVTVDGVSPYFCGQLGGAHAGGRCRAPYQPFSGDACAVFQEVGADNAGAQNWLRQATSTCSPAMVEQAMEQTIINRAKLRGYVSSGSDESVNDPVSNPSFRPRGATAGAGEAYFAAECAVRTCGTVPGKPAVPRTATQGQRPTGPDNQAVSPPVTTGRQPGVSTSSATSASQDQKPPGRREASDGYFALTICNATGGPIWMALGSRNSPESDDWYVKGWWSIPDDHCKPMGKYPKRDIYLFARGPKGGTWGGKDLNACILDDAFDHSARDTNCSKQARKGFAKRRTQADSLTVTVQALK